MKSHSVVPLKCLIMSTECRLSHTSWMQWQHSIVVMLELWSSPVTHTVCFCQEVVGIFWNMSLDDLHSCFKFHCVICHSKESKQRTPEWSSCPCALQVSSSGWPSCEMCTHSPLHLWRCLRWAPSVLIFHLWWTVLWPFSLAQAWTQWAAWRRKYLQWHMSSYGATATL